MSILTHRHEVDSAVRAIGLDELDFVKAALETAHVLDHAEHIDLGLVVQLVQVSHSHAK
jgi:hypothetical protein